MYGLENKGFDKILYHSYNGYYELSISKSLKHYTF